MAKGKTDRTCLTRETITQIFNRRRLLLLSNLLVLLLVGGRLEPLPRQTSTQKVHEDVTEGLEIISS